MLKPFIKCVDEETEVVLQQIDQIANGLIEADPTSSRNKTFSEPSDGTSRLQIHLLTEPVI